MYDVNWFYQVNKLNITSALPEARKCRGTPLASRGAT